MGGCVSVQVSCDQLLNHLCKCFCRKLSFIHNLKKNLTALEEAMEDLKAVRADLLCKVQTAEERGLQRLHQIKVWLKRVKTIESQFNDLNSSRTVELQRLCFYGASSNNLRLSYCYGKKVFVMLNVVQDLKSKGFFEEVAHAAVRAMAEERPLQPTIVGQETILEKAWNHLMDDGTKIMGLYGMGGVGKTTLLTRINNRFCDTDDGVEIVIWVVVSGDIQIHKIQKEIGEKIGFKGVEWNQKSENQKAVDIHNFLSKKRFVLLLDDIWKRVELTEIGIPNPTSESGCKIAFTTRCQSVCASMGVHDPMEVRCLGTVDAWDLFKEKVGEITLRSHPDIPEIARKVARACRGLPLALNVIGETMACKKTTQEWDHAVDFLTTYAANFGAVKEKILPILKYSYDNLESESVKSCFKYCSLFPEDTLIEKERLIDYWICEGFIDEYESKEGAVNKGHVILGNLVRASLLVEGEKFNNKSYVKMHDVVREMALWIASDIMNQNGNCIVRAGVGLNEIPKVKDWKVLRRMSLVNNRIKEISGSPECPKLTTLFLQDNRLLVNISGEFFRSMPKLVVLDLSWNVNLKGLPEQISELVSLRYLDLSDSSIGRLPVGLLKLKNLVHLNLESMLCLESVSGIDHLPSLKTLRLLNLRMWLTISLLEELKRLENLEVLTIEITSSSALEQLLCSHRLVRCLQKVSIKFLDEESVRILTLPSIGDLREVFIGGCGMRDIIIERNTSLTSPSFPNLSKVLIAGCNGLKDLTWLLFAPNLTHLNVWNSRQVEELISQEKAGRADDIVPFRKLEYLHLWDLPELKSIYWSPLPFPCLNRINVQNKCRKLRKLPLDSQSCIVAGEELLVIQYGDEEWKERVEWEDEATRLRFLPSCKLVLYNR
ncbi:PREDICTED: probable disease resistance protein At1g12290 isoform X2 [Camelina sativa]|uniref:Probable disease resistance protein At1g12290 isoform X2 n=1 Tax=Camelina sativa TaxID=90675 RepID=A0ABM1R5P7_CAMSA|nr:PREDICTED: probable disease resistance protein At1g12290 isoform X2 [Camelina sativa]